MKGDRKPGSPRGGPGRNGTTSPRRHPVYALPPEKFDRLTEREKEALELVAQAKSNKEIARAMRVSPSTAKAHVSGVLRKLGVESRLEAAMMWAEWLRGHEPMDDRRA